jgi:hypothetical protein
MKHLSVVALAILVITGCGQKSGGSEYSDEGEESLKFLGTFSRKEGDTLKMTSYDPESYSPEMEFEIQAIGETAQVFLFNYAPEGDYINDDVVQFFFKDSTDMSFEDLVFLYNYKDDSWTIEDNISKQGRDPNRVIDFSGVYKRAN